MFRTVAKTGKMVAIHAEDFGVIKRLTEEVQATGAADYAAMLKARPDYSELNTIETAIRLSKILGTHLHILHLATGDGVEVIRRAQKDGVNVTAVVYAPAFGFVYNGMDEMVRAYCKAPNSVCIEQGVDWREGICRDNKVDGVLVHYNRSCKPWSGYMAEMQRRFTADLGIPCAGFDGDQADPRNFNEAQYETRVQGLVEAMEANRLAKE
jgi:benzoyl-CoA reductase/2-hydroxyglutaryl-CoA dehydratase subunit BcrC/BadD/HgdB